MSRRLPVGNRFYWDEHCKLCNHLKTVAVALDWQKRIDFLPLLSEQADIDLGHLDMEERMASSHLVTSESRVLSGGAGILGLASLLPLLAPLVFIYRLLPRHMVLADKLYKMVASNRGVPYGGSCQVDFSGDGSTERSC